MELGTTREKLALACEVCLERLDIFRHCTAERRVGLASELEIECPRCGCLNTVSTCKSHATKRKQSEEDASMSEPTSKRTKGHSGGKIYDVNTKAVLGKSILLASNFALS